MDLRAGARVTVDGLEVELVHAGLLRLTGSLRTPAACRELPRVLAALHARLATELFPRIVVDLRQLDFVNSSALRPFLDWIKLASGVPYTIVFRIDPSIAWQRLSVSVLQTLAPGTVELTEETTGVGRAARRTGS
jgi:hypothetical protein